MGGLLNEDVEFSCRRVFWYLSGSQQCRSLLSRPRLVWACAHALRRPPPAVLPCKQLFWWWRRQVFWSICRAGGRRARLIAPRKLAQVPQVLWCCAAACGVLCGGAWKLLFGHAQQHRAVRSVRWAHLPGGVRSRVSQSKWGRAHAPSARATWECKKISTKSEGGGKKKAGRCCTQRADNNGRRKHPRYGASGTVRAL